jgi:hypothetical protein
MPARDNRILPQPEARAIGAVTALNVKRVAPAWKPSGTRNGPCMSIFPDGSRIPFGRTPKPRERKNPNIVIVAAPTKKQQITSLIMSLPAANGGNPDA